MIGGGKVIAHHKIISGIIKGVIDDDDVIESPVRFQHGTGDIA